MNPMTISTAAASANSTVTAAATSASAKQIGPSGSEGTQSVSAFATLLMGIFSDASLVDAANTDTPAAPAASNAMEQQPVDSAVDEGQQTLEEMLDQLLQMMEAMAPEMKQWFADWAPAQQWTASASFELAVALGDLTSAFQADLLPSAGSASTEQHELFQTLLTHVADAMKQQPHNLQLNQVVVAAGQVLKDFMSAALAITNAQSEGVDDAMQANSLAAHNKPERQETARLRQGVAILLTQMDGDMSVAKELSQEPAQAKINSHLSAMESKSGAVRFSVVSLAASIGVNAEMSSTEESKPLTDSATGLSSLADAAKTTAAGTAQRGEALPARMNAAAFAQEMSEWILRQAAGGRMPTVTEAKLSLTPEHLGQLEVKISVHNGQLTAQFTAESAMAKDMLEANLQLLRTNLQNQGVQVEKLAVSQQASLGSGMFQDSKQRQHAGQDQRQNKGHSSDSVEDWAEVMNAGFEAGEESRIQTYGGSFHATV